MTPGEQPEHPPALNDLDSEPAPLIDLSTVPLTELRTTQSPVLDNCIRRLEREVADAEAATAGFNSAV
jgi:FXSXX-COOH protein